MPHALPHPPQLLGLVRMSTQVVPQSVCPTPHTVLHTPPEHVDEAGHAMPQPPQLLVSLLVLTHAPLQLR